MSVEVVYKEFARGLCPFCGAESVEGESVTIEDGEAFQECCCTACDRDWVDRYKLFSFISEGVAHEETQIS
jgi:transposase-like protein